MRKYLETAEKPSSRHNGHCSLELRATVFICTVLAHK